MKNKSYGIKKIIGLGCIYTEEMSYENDYKL